MTVVSHEDVRPCGGTLGLYDRFVSNAYRYWHDEPPPGDLELTLELRSRDEGPRGRAYAADRRAWVRASNSDLHELTHLVVGFHDAWSAPVLSEGIAEALGPDSRVNLIGPPAWPVSHFAFKGWDEFEPGDYIRGAQLVSFLIRRYGVSTVRQSYQAIERDASAEEIEAGFVEVFGDGIYDAFDEFEATDQCPLFAWECGGEVLPVVSLPLVLDEGEGCDDPNTLGAVAEGDESWYPYRMVTLDLGDQPVTVTMSVSDNAFMRVDDCMTSCDEVTATSSFRVPPPGDTNVVDWELPAGRHLVTVRPRDPTQPFSASIVRAEP